MTNLIKGYNFKYMYFKAILTCLICVVFSLITHADEPKAINQEEQKKMQEIEKVKRLITCDPFEESDGLFLVTLKISNEVTLDQGSGFTLSITSDKGGTALQNTMLPFNVGVKLGTVFYISRELIKNSELAMFFSVNNKKYYMRITFIENDKRKYLPKFEVVLKE